MQQYLSEYYTSNFSSHIRNEEGVKTSMDLLLLQRYSLFVGFFFGLLSPSVVVVVDGSPSGTCFLCGDQGPSIAPFGEKLLPALGTPVNRCLELEEAAVFIQRDTKACDAVQAFGTYCGCNKPPSACSLCWDGSNAVNQNVTLFDYRASMFVDTFGFDGNLTCELLESFLHTTRLNNSEQCLNTQIDAGERCGCPPLPVELLPNHNSTNSTTTNEEEEEEEEPSSSWQRCTLCETGDPPPFPDKLVDIGRDQDATCEEWDLLAGAFEEGSGDCALVRTGASRSCQCPRPQGLCTMCPLGEPIPKPQQRLNWYTDSFLSSDRDMFVPEDSRARFLTCELMESNVANRHPLLEDVFGTEEELLCTAMQMKSWICGCKPDWRQIVLTWSYRLSGMLSLTVRSQIFTFSVTCQQHCLTNVVVRGRVLSLLQSFENPIDDSQRTTNSSSAYPSST